MKESIFAGNAANLALTPLFTTRLIQNKIKNSSKKYSRYHITFPDQIFRIHELLVPDTLWAVSSQEPGFTFFSCSGRWSWCQSMGKLSYLKK